jgi:hypothetical protein
MGVDFYACKSCGDTFPDCGDYTGCECGNHWCCDSCAEADGYRREEDVFTPEGSSWEQETSCSQCRGEDYEDYELLSHALGLLGITRKELITKYKASK